jgi:peptide/nickel transport system ATP-binding protein
VATTVDRPGTVPATPTGTDPAVASRAERPRAAEALLEIRDLRIHFRTPAGLARVVDGVNLTVHRNEIVGIAGESGCGKTTLIEAILQIVRFPHRETHGEVLFTPRGKPTVDLMRQGPRAMRRLRGQHIAYVPQGSMNSLNPVLRVEEQITEGMIDHGVPRRKAKARVPELLERVGLDPGVARKYPHELSGGMRQRVIIAIAIAMDPELIVADEPTTALDVNVQRLVLETLLRLRDEMDVAILIVSHDLPVHAQLAERIGIMYAGQVVETGDIRPTVKQPLHPYTRGLMGAIPAIGDRERIEGIGGSTPSPLEWPSGCHFRTRCQQAMDVCAAHQPILARVSRPVPAGDAVPSGDGASRPPGLVACHLYPESTPEEARR